ncbi:hypothetical protein ACQXZ6_09220 [Corynebacterium diphtheriae]|nr:hypothetical protein [Corynebacterium diphtheriae]
MVGFSPKRYKYDVYLLGKQKEKSEAAVNEKAYDKALSLAGWKGYVTSIS